jgi:hypothetical protein
MLNHRIFDSYKIKQNNNLYEENRNGNVGYRIPGFLW